jgi:hypothetical protein
MQKARQIFTEKYHEPSIAKLSTSNSDENASFLLTVRIKPLSSYQFTCSFFPHDETSTPPFSPWKTDVGPLIRVLNCFGCMALSSHNSSRYFYLNGLSSHVGHTRIALHNSTSYTTMKPIIIAFLLLTQIRYIVATPVYMDEIIPRGAICGTCDCCCCESGFFCATFCPHCGNGATYNDHC